MEENKIEIQKLNLIQKTKIWYYLRKLEGKKNFSVWENIKDNIVKFNPEILELAWKIAYESGDFSKLGLFPNSLKFEKASLDEEIIQYLDAKTQRIIASTEPEKLEKCSVDVQKALAEENPKVYILYAQKSVQKEIFPLLDDKSQKDIISKDKSFILSAKEIVKKDILAEKSIDSTEWQTIISNEQNLTLDKLIHFFEQSGFSYSYDKDTLKETIKYYISLSDKSEFIKQFQGVNIKQRNRLLDRLTTYMDVSNIQTNNFQSDMLEIMLENTDILYNDGIDGKYPMHSVWNKFDINIVNKKFEQKYGNEKLEQYQSIIEKAFKTNDLKLINLLFVDESIIKKVSSEKVLNYIDNWKELENEEYIINVKHLPISYDIKRKRKQLKDDFDDIVLEAYGEKAQKIVSSRPGLTLRDIENTEILSDNIVGNFREGFVHDFLSYDIEGTSDFVRISKNKEDLEAFKLLYNRMSSKLGENVVTMQMCISRFPEYASLLKNAKKLELSEEQLNNIDKVCSWPVNICKIDNVNELNDLNEKFKKAIDEYSHWRDARILDSKLEKDILRTNLNEETILFDYQNPDNLSLETLSKEEKQLLDFCYPNRDEEYLYRPLDLSVDKLRQAKDAGIDLSSIFLNQYTVREKIKEDQMNRFNKEMTNMEKIYEAEKEGKYGTKVIKIGNVELIDFGSMPVSFASHKPNMNNSFVSFYGGMTETKDGMNQYLEYDGTDGISTISALPIVESTDQISRDSYLYWDFKDNEIMSLKESGGTPNTNGDGMVSHKKKQVKSTGISNRTIKRL